MRRLLSISLFILTLFALFGLSGCNGDKGGSTATGGGVTKADGTKYKVFVSIPAADHGWTAGVKWWAEEAKKLYPDVEMNIQTAENPEKQIKDLETAMVSNPDAVVVLATESAPLTPIAKQIHERGILLVNVDRGFLEPVADVFIEGDNKAFGRKSAEFVAQKMNGQGNLLIFEGIPSTVNTDRVNAAKEVFAQHPGIKILDSQSGMWNQQKAYEVAQTMLLKHPQIDAIWAQDDDMALGVEKALKEAGRDKNVWMLGGAGMKDIVKRVMDGDAMFPANITYPPSMIAVGIHNAVAMLRAGKDQVKKFMPRHILIDVELITPENAKDYYFPDSIY